MTKDTNNPEEDKKLTKLISLLTHFFDQPVPTPREEFKAELEQKMAAEVAAKEKSQKSRYTWMPLKKWLVLPRFRYAVLATSLVILLVAGLIKYLPTSPAGDTLQGALVNSFSTTPVYANAELNLIKEGDTAQGVGLSGGFTLVSKSPLDPESFIPAITLTPATQGTYEWSDDNTRVTFRPTESLKAGERYTVQIADTATNREGELMGADMQWVFQAVPVFAMTGTTPEALTKTAPQETTIEIEFNWFDLNAEKFAEYFTLSPETSGKFETQGNKMVFLPDSPLQAEVIYRAKLRAGFDNGAGQSLAEDYTWEFQTQTSRYQSEQFAAEPWFNFDLGSGGIVNEIVGNAISIEGTADNFPEGSALGLTLYETDLPSLLAARVYNEGQITPVRVPQGDSLREITSWTVDVGMVVTSGSVNSWNTIYPRIDLPELESGIYFVKATHEKLKHDRYVYVVVSEAGIRQIAPQVGGAEDGYLWLVDFPSGGVKPNEPAKFYSLAGGVNLVNERPSDDKGLIKLDGIGEDVDVIVAGDAVLFMANGLEPDVAWGYRGGGFNPYDTYVGSGIPYRALLSTDRPLYRPGDKIFFKTSIRERTSTGYRVPSGGEKYVVMLYSDGEKLFEQDVDSLNAFGSYAGEITLPDTITTDWSTSLRVYIRQGEELTYIGSHGITLADYRKPDFELGLSLSQSEVMSGESVEAVGMLKYFFGEPIVDKAITYTVYEEDYHEPRPGQERYDDRSYYGGSQVATGEGRTNSAGEFRFKIDTGLKENVGQSKRYTVQVDYVDDLQVTNVAADNLVIHTSDIKLLTDTENQRHQVGTGIDTDIASYDVFTDASKAPVSPVTVVVTRSWYERFVSEETVYNPATKTQVVKQRYDYSPRTEEMSRQEVGLDAGGKGRFTFTPTLPGSYTLGFTASGQNSRVAATSQYLWITDNEPALWWSNETSGLLSLTADKEQYELNDQANFTVTRSDNHGAALVIVQQERFARVEVFDLTRGPIRFSQGIDSSLTPNFSVKVYSPAQDEYEGYALDNLEPTVDMDYQRLAITLTPNATEFLPAGTLELGLETVDAAGNPVESESVVYLIDKALLALKPDHAADWFEQLYAPLYYYEQTKSSTADQYGYRGVGAEGGGGGGDAGVPRSDFKDSAAFSAFVQTNAEGKANVSLPLPHNLTTWLVVTQTITKDAKVGIATTEVVVSKELVVRPSLPTAFVVGDTLTLSTVVHNFTDAEQALRFELSGEGFDTVTTPPAELSLGAGKEQTVDAVIRIQDRPSAKIAVKAYSEGEKFVDQVIQDIPVFPKTIEMHKPIIHTLTKDQPLEVEYTGSSDSRNYLSLTVSPALLSSLTSVWAEVSAPTYGSTPELVERILTNAAVLRDYDVFSPWASREAITQAIQADVTQLTALRRFSYDSELDVYTGGWGYTDYDAISTELSAKVLLALAEAKNLTGVTILLEDFVLEQAASALNGQVPSDTISLDDQALMVYALTRAGKVDLVKVQALAEQANQMLSGSVAYLALALGEQDDSTRARSLLSGLEDRLKHEDNMSYLDDQAGTHQQPQSRIKQTALVLEAASVLRLKGEKIEAMARWLDQARQSYDWSRLFDQAQTTRALLAYHKQTVLAQPDFKYRLDWNDEEIASGQITGGKQTEGEAKIRVPADKLRTGKNILRMTADNPGQLYLAGELVWWGEDIPEGSERVSLERRYFSQDGEEKTTFNRGDLVIVEYRYDGTSLEESVFSEASLQLIDYLPSGLEYINSSFENVSEAERQLRWNVLMAIPDDQQLWAWPRVSGSQLSLSTWHPIPAINEYYRYPRIYRVLARAAFAGEYTARSATIQSLNMPSVEQYTEGTTLTIKND